MIAALCAFTQALRRIPVGMVAAFAGLAVKPNCPSRRRPSADRLHDAARRRATVCSCRSSATAMPDRPASWVQSTAPTQRAPAGLSPSVVGVPVRGLDTFPRQCSRPTVLPQFRHPDGSSCAITPWPVRPRTPPRPNSSASAAPQNRRPRSSSIFPSTAYLR